MSAVVHIGSFPAFGEFALVGQPADSADSLIPHPCTPVGIPDYLPFTQFAYGLTLEKAMRAYWIVREYTLTVDLICERVTPFPIPPTPMVETRTIAAGSFPGQVSREEDLVTGPSFTIDPPEFLWFTSMFAAPGDFLSPPDPVWGPNLVRVDSTYYPQFYFRYGDGDSDFGYTWSTFPYNFSGGALPQKDAVFISNFFGGIIPMYGDEGTIVTGTVTLEPSRYWSHGGVWDEATGELLNPAGIEAANYFQFR